jgi:signal transduction histidine kinase
MPVEVNTYVVTIQGKKVMLGVVRDITARKQAEEALRQVNKKLNLLSGITRHDINNQLFSLKAFLELSKESLGDAARTSEYILKEERAANAIERQIVFTEEYQDLGVKAPVWQSVDACIKRAQDSLPMRDVRVIMDSPDVEVFADPLFEKVFYNLIDNALRYGGQKMALIRITSQGTGPGLVISVEDDGVGISAEDKKQLFERGFGHHTGLGLFLSREILSITGITITETSEPGKGARFEILVPVGGYWISG